MHRLLYFIIILSFFQCNVHQDVTDPYVDRVVSDGPRDGRPGACYAKCLMPDQWVGESENYAVYTGEDGESNSNVEYVEIELKPESTKWVKKRADRNCRSTNPDDCLVWCLVQQARETIILPVVIDTTLTDQFAIEPVTINPELLPGGHTEWREVVCQNKRTVDLINKVQHALIQNGYEVGAINGEFNRFVQEALTKYQVRNGLPIGQLDYETLAALNVDEIDIK